MKGIRGAALALAAWTAAGCAQAGALGDVLGGVLNAPANQVSGTIRDVDTRYHQLSIESNGQVNTFSYDDQTQVVYQNQNYPVTALEQGDQVVARYQNNGNNVYYVDMIEVTQSVSNSGGNSGSLYTLQGNVRSVDRSNGIFTMSTQSSGVITVSMPYNSRTSDINRFNALRVGDYVQIQGLYLNESRVELRQFY